MTRKNVFYISIVVYFIGILFLINNTLLHTKYKNSNFELPLIGFQGLIEKNDTIYLGSSHWNRIFLYDKNGKYLTYQATGGRGLDFDFYFSENNLVINQYSLAEKPNKDKTIFSINKGEKYIIEKKLPVQIDFEKNGKKINFLKQNLLFYLFYSDIGLWFVLIFYSLFIVAAFQKELIELLNKIKLRFK
ncbi:hypothetical protein [Flavobacterium channae]|uniref:hypothetical protein n=1 Tax=Flavobacterium channae TaxID=2897181 RepID=UPI001E447E50|nr:hypothetical protein [Flavobacterium channae]UGS22611.1 hypothetical protein LOS89_07435 [Flavobacterium channae]